MQFFIDFLFKTKKKRIIVGISILIIGLISIWASFSLQQKEKIANDISHQKELVEQKYRFNRLDSLNTRLSAELNLRNSDIQLIKEQNDSLKILLDKLNSEQKKFLLLSEISTKEVSKSRVALENMGYKQIKRGISEYDKIQMINVLKEYSNSNLKLTTVMGDQEAIQFTSQIKEVFDMAGWNVDGINQAVYTGVVQGVIISVKAEKYPTRVNSIFEAFKILGIISKGEINDKLELNEVSLIIGSK